MHIILRNTNKFEYLVIFTVALCFFPSDAIGMIVPLLFIFFFFLLEPAKRWHSLVLFFQFAVFVFVMGIFYSLLPIEFIWRSYFLFWVTASSIFIIPLDFQGIVRFKHLNKWLILLIGFQGLYACVETVAGFVVAGRIGGDNVTGTVDPRLVAYGGGAMTVFCVLMVSIIIFVLSTSNLKCLKKRDIVCLFLGISGVFFASVSHVMLFFFLALVLSFLPSTVFFDIFRMHVNFYRKFNLLLSVICIVCVSMLALLSALTPNLLSAATVKFEQFVNFDSRLPRNVLTRFVFNDLEDYLPTQYIWGIGAGQFSSRASLIASGEYLSVDIPFFDHTTQIADKAVLPLMKNVENNRLIGNPSSSYYNAVYGWLSIYSEFGLFGIIGVLVFVFLIIAKIAKASQFNRKLSYGLFTLLFFLLLLPFWDNYWERAQAIFPAFLLLKIGYTCLLDNSLSVRSN